MKKILLIIAALFVLQSCASSASMSISNCFVSGCEISAVHHHAIY